MGRYVIRRVLQFIPVLLGALFLLHYLTTLGIQLNGNPARAFFGDRTPPPGLVEQLERAWGIDDPCLDTPGNPCLGIFVERLGNYAQGEFGENFRGRQVTELMADRFPQTIRLALLAMLLITVFGVLAGIWAGLRSGRFSDYLVKISTVVLIATPIFVLGRLAQWRIGLDVGEFFDRQDWAPDFLVNMFTPAYRAEHPWLSLFVPAVVLAALSLAYVARLTRTSLVENVRADYVRTAVSKGLKRTRVVGVHTLRNSLIPVVTLLGITVGDLMAGAVVTEFIFNIPGVGRLVIDAGSRGEAPVVIVVVTVLVIVYMIMTLIVDVLYAVLDPRIRYE